MFYFEIPVNAKIDFCSAGQFIAHKRPIHPSRSLDTHVLLLGCSGEYPIAQDGREHVLAKDTFILLPAGMRHYGTLPASEGQSHLWCHFTADCDVRESDDYPDRTGSIILPEHGKITNPEIIHVLARQMIDSEYRTFADFELKQSVCDSFIRIILSELSDGCKAEQSGLSGEKNILLVSKVEQYIKYHACEGIRAVDVAEYFSYNSDYLSSLLRSATGKNLSEHLSAVRIMTAKKLLLETDLRIAEVALRSGFADSKYFMRLFRKSEGLTPLEYRQIYAHLHINQ